MITTCGDCPKLKFNNDVVRIYYCGITKNIVPQYCDGKKYIFHRVPLECPRAKGVLKSEKKRPKNEWVIRINIK